MLKPWKFLFSLYVSLVFVASAMAQTDSSSHKVQFVTAESGVPRIESSDCIFKSDSAHKTRCGYLVVPEDRRRPRGKVIKLPFIYVESDNPAKKPDPVLYTGGGPGVSSLHPVTSIADRALLRDRDYIAF